MGAQRFKNQFLKQMIFLILIHISVNQVSQFNQSCGLGCLECTKQLNCIKCIQGYQLQQTVCSYSNCPQGLFYQKDSNNLNENLGKCVAICSNSYYQSTSQNSCIKVEQCPLSYQSKFIFRDNGIFYDLFQYKNDTVIILLSNSLVQIQRQNGQYLQEVLLPKNLITIQVYQNQIVAVRQDLALVLWDLDQNQLFYLNQIQLSLKKNEQPILFRLQNQYLIGYNIQIDKSLIEFQLLLSLQNLFPYIGKNYQYNLPLNQQIQILDNLIIIINSIGIRIDKIFINSNNNFEILYMTNHNFLCQYSFQTKITSFLQSNLTSQYAFILENSFNVYMISQFECISNKFNQIPIKLFLVYLLSSEYFVIQFEQYIEIDDDKFNKQKILNFPQAKIIQIMSIYQEELPILLILLSNQQIQQVAFQMINNQVNFENIKQILVVINNPASLYYLPSLQETNILERIFIVGEGVQSVILSTKNNDNNYTEKKQYLIQNYEFFFDKISSLIQQTLVIDQINYLINCATEGIFVWDISHIYRFKYLYSIKSNGDYCLELYHLQNYDILISYNDKILILDLSQFTIKQLWNINQIQQNIIPKISVSTSYCVMAFNLNLFIYQYSYDQLKLVNFSQNTSYIQSIFILPDDQLLIQLVNELQLFQLNLNDFNSEVIFHFTTKAYILMTKIRQYSQNYFEVNVYLQDQSFFILNQKLQQILVVNNIPLLSIQDFQFMNNTSDDSYYFLGKTSQINSSYSTVVLCIFKSDPQIYQAIQATGGQQILSIKQQVDDFSTFYYIITLLINKTTYSNVVQFQYFPKTKIFYFYNNYYQLNKSQQQTQFVNKNQISTFQNGFIGSHQNIQFFSQQIYRSNDYNNNQNSILDVIQNYKMGIIFVIKQSSFLTFNIYTYVLIEEVFFGKQEDQIINYYLIQEKNIFIACKKDIIITKEYKTVYNNNNNNNNNNNKSQQMNFLNGCIVYRTAYQYYIITYGQQIQIFNLNLTLIHTFENQQEGLIMSSCKEMNSLLFCKTQGIKQQLVIFDLINYELLQKIFSIDLDSNFHFEVDGLQVEKIVNLKQEISDLLIFRQYIIILQSSSQSYITIYDRKTFQFLHEFIIQTQGQIIYNLIVEQYNHLLISIDNIQMGQIFVYDLSKMTFVTSIFNYYPSNNPNVVISMIFDKDFNLLNFLDKTGNIYSIIYTNLQAISFIVKFYQFSNGQMSVAKGMSIDFITNSCFVFNDSLIFYMNYSMQTNTYNQQQLDKNKFFTKINDQQEILNRIYLILGQKNTIYIYKNYKVLYFGSILNNQQILEIQYYEAKNYLIIAFQMEIRVYNFTQVLLNKNIQIDDLLPESESKFSFNNFLLPDIFLTLDNKMIHYNYQNMGVLFQIQLSSILSEYYLNKSDNILILGLLDGSIIIYFLNTHSYISYSLTFSQTKNSIKFIQETESFIWVGSLNGYLIGLNKTSFEQIYKINLNQISNNTLEVTSISIDELYNRIFFSFLNQNLVYCKDYSNLKTVKDVYFLIFPGSQYNRIEITQNYLILYSTFQLNIHNRQSLEYIINIRRQNLYDSINKLFIIQEQFYLLIYNNKLELFYIDIQNKQSYLLDQVQILNIKILDIIYNKSSQNLRAILATNNQIFEQNYSLNYYLKKIYLNQFECNLVIGGQNLFEIQKQLQSILPFSQQQSTQLGMNYLLNTSYKKLILLQISTQDFSKISFQDLNQNILSIAPYYSEKQNLIITEDLFSNYPLSQIQLTNFTFILKDKNITFNKNIQVIQLQNIDIADQNLFDIQFLFQDIDQIIIQNILIQNLSIEYQEKLSLFSFINCRVLTINNLMKSIMNLNIIQLKVQKSSFSSFFLLEDIQFVDLNSFSITYCNKSSESIQSYFINGSIFYSTKINLVTFNNNKNIQFLDYKNVQSNQNYLQQLTSDLIQLQNLYFQDNFFSNLGQFLINLQANQIDINEINYIRNNAGIYLMNFQSIYINNSQFINNTGINGGALFVENNSILFNILNSQFLGNVAKANGGAIYFKEQQGIINIDQLCSIKQNHAQIGGGLRIKNSNLYAYSTNLLSQVQLLDIRNNTADISGQNYSFGLSSIEVISITSASQDNQTIQYYFKNNQGINQDQYSGQLNILNLKSGDKLNIALGIKDEENNFLVFKTDLYKSNQYQTDIQNELSQFSFSLQSIDQQQIQLEGQITIRSDSFQSEIKSFIFNQVSITGQPLGTGHLKLNFKKNEFSQKPILVFIQFRNCILGEEFKHLIFNLYSCQYCQLGSYSLENYSNYNISYISSQGIQPSCQQCPVTADQCQRSNIQIKQGYWRINKYADEIIQCVNNPLNCQEQEDSSLNGCIEGYIGPLCEECDIFGIVWQKRYTKKSFSQFECGLCQSFTVQILYISGVIIFITTYGLISTIIFMNSFFYTQKCYYLRQSSMLPISKSSCRQIGNMSQLSLDVNIDCTDKENQKFNTPFAGSILIILNVIPLYIFYQLRKAKHQLNYLQIYLPLAQISQFKQNCGLGCQDCNSYFNCLQCTEDFKLENGTCHYSKCPQGLFYQQDSNKYNPNIGKCVAICDNSYYQSTAQNTCIKVEQCPLSFQSESVFSDGRVFKDLFQYQNDTILILLSSSIVQIQRQNGQYLKEVIIPKNLLSVQVFQNLVIAVRQDFVLVQWDLISKQVYQLNQIQLSLRQGQQPVLLCLSNSYLIGYNIQIEKSLIEIQFLLSLKGLIPSNNNVYQYQIPNTNTQQIQIIGNMIILASQNGIRIDLISINSSSSLEILYFTNHNFLCNQNFNSKILIILQNNQTEQQYHFIVENKNYIYTISQSACFAHKLNQPPLNLNLVQLANIEYFVLQFQDQIYFTDNKFNISQILNFAKVSVISIKIVKQQLPLLLILLSNKQIQYLKLQIINDQLNLGTINNIQALINNPSLLYYLPAIIEANTQERLFIIGESIQSNLLEVNNNSTLNTEKKQYIIQNYEFSYDRIQSKIKNTLVIDDINLLQKILEVNSIPLLSLTDFSFMEDPSDDSYFFVGKTNKINTSYPVVVLCTFKSDPQIFQAVQISAASQIVNKQFYPLANQQDAQNLIIDVIQNYKIGLVIVIKEKSFIVFNIYTHNLIEEVFFGNIKNPIIKYEIIQDDYLFIAYVTIFDRHSFFFKHEFVIETQGYITCSLLVKQYGHLLISTDNTLMAQIYVYDLNQMVFVINILSSFPSNNPSVVKSLIYDKDYNQLNFLDKTGNIYSIVYTNLQSVSFLIKFYQFNTPQLPLAKGMNIDFITNSCFAFSDSQIFYVNYSQLTNFFIQQSLDKNNFFTKVTYQKSNQQFQSIFYLMLGQNNTIYIYSNYTILYLGSILNNQQVLDIQYFDFSRYLIIAFQQEIRVYDFTQVLLNLNSQLDDFTFKQELRFSVHKFLAFDIFLTLDNKMIHYNYYTMDILFQIQLNSSLSEYYLNKLENFIVLGLTDGSTVIYSLNTHSYISYSLNLSQNKNSIKFIQETESFIWSGSLNGNLIGLNKTSFEQVYKLNLNQVSNNTVLLEVTTMSVDELNTRIFFSYLNQNLVYCKDYSTQKSITDVQFLKFPGSQYNRIEITQNYLILYSTFQLNIQNRQSLEYIINIRRQNLYDSINKIFIAQEQFYLLFFNNKMELFYLDIQNKQSYLLDQVQITNLKIVDTVYNQNSQYLKVILAKSNQMFENNYSLNYYLKKIYQNQFECNLIIGGQTFFEMQKQIQSIQPFSQQQSTQLGMNYLYNLSAKKMINIQISTQDFSQIAFNQLDENILRLAPNNYEKPSLVITQDLFANYPHSQIQLTNFRFIIKDKNITFNQNVQSIYLQNIKISDQKLQDVKFIFQNVDQVIIQDILIQNVNMINQEDYLSFFTFVNCRIVTIYNLTVQNIGLVSEQNSYLFQMKSIINLTIVQLKVQESSFSSFFLLEDIQFVDFNTFYIKDCNKNLQTIESYFIHGSIFYNTKISQVEFNNNNKIQFIDYNNSKTNLNVSQQLNYDQIKIQNCQFKFNLISNKNSYLINLQANEIIMNNLTYLNNSANIHLIKVQNIQISNSQFINNLGINGGALFIENNSIQFNVSNSTFQGNVAKANGGAIYFKEQQGIINIDQLCSIKYNHAKIGGGFRIQNSNLYEHSSELLSQVKLRGIQNNTADIFSQNYNLGLSRVDVISITSLTLDNKPIEYNFKQNSNQNQYSGQLNLLNLKSGDMLNIALGIKDEENSYLVFNTETFQNNLYQTEIQNELSQFSFSLQPIDQQQIQLEGQFIIRSDSFQSEIKSFVFTQASIIGQPLGAGNCILGEEFKNLIFNIYSCQYCQLGSYSLKDYTNYNISDINIQNIQSSCQLCPKTADYCQGEIIKIKQGYWRINQHSDEIIKCVNNPLNCQEQAVDSINGCVKGYVGPLCEECDIFGVVCNSNSHSFNFQKNKSFLSQKIPFLHYVECKNSNSAEQETNNFMNYYLCSQSNLSKLVPQNIINQKSFDFQDVKKEVESLESISTIFEKLTNKGYVKQLSDFLDHLILEELNFTYAELQKIMMNLANQKNLNFNEQFQINCNIFKTCFFQIINIIVQKSWQKQYGVLQQTSIPSIQQIHDKAENARVHESQKNESGGEQSLENEKLKEQNIIKNSQKLDQYQIYKISNLSQLYKSDQLEQIMSVGAISSEESVYQVSQQKIQIDPTKESIQNTPSNTTNTTAYENTFECKDSRRRTKSSINPKEYIRQLVNSDQKLSLLLNVNEYDKSHMFKKILEKHKQNLIYRPKQQQTVRNSVMRSSFFSPSQSYNKKDDLFIINLSEFAQSNAKLKQSFSISERRSNVNQIKQTPSPCDYDIKKSEKIVRPNSPTQVFSKSPRQSWIENQTKKEGVYQINTQYKQDTKRSNLSVKKITSNSGVK
ncbi:hypothetical protein ABPG72_020217 [Tetrahymena utriculariae]